MYSVIGSDGQVYGPVEASEVSQWIKDGRVLPTTNLVNAATGKIMPASAIPEFSGLLSYPTPPPVAQLHQSTSQVNQSTDGASPREASTKDTILSGVGLLLSITYLGFGATYLLKASSIRNNVAYQLSSAVGLSTGPDRSTVLNAAGAFQIFQAFLLAVIGIWGFFIASGSANPSSKGLFVGSIVLVVISLCLPALGYAALLLAMLSITSAKREGGSKGFAGPALVAALGVVTTLYGFGMFAYQLTAG